MSRVAEAALIIALSAASFPAKTKQLPGALVDTEWLAQHRDGVVLLDVRKDEEGFSARGGTGLDGRGHIPGAVLVPTKQIRAIRKTEEGELLGMLPAPDAVEELMRASGVSTESSVVITNPGIKAKNITNAARLYWTLKYFGHDGVALLDGGTFKWAMEKRRITHEASLPQRGDFKTREPRDELVADSTDLARALQEKDVQLIDTRPLEYYLGLRKKPYVRAAGHIPGAHSYPYPLLFHHLPLTFRSPETIQEIARAMGIDPQAPAITYCNSGRLSSSTWFALHELVGNDRVSMYDGSMHEWTRSPNAAVVKLKMGY